ncbi:hypothetical protein I3843_11G114800 [Carya illinoinensis]|nr:hypothetical protein I3843_11G114800 [Carya illinoinensis]KAG7956249.1 hypothetical protein I3843_11G114800 [Carya illinoinensis]
MAEACTYFFVFSLLFSLLEASITRDTLPSSQSIRDGDTLVSAGGTFEMGFFSPGSSKSRYIGIWYVISSGTVVWVANRDTPLNDHSGVLTVTDEGVLALLNSTNNVVWSTNTSRTAENPVAQLLDTGNLVVKDGNVDDPERFLWQSFDYPCDTLLPKMKIGRDLVTGLDRVMSSWKSTEDPARGDFTVRLDPRGLPQRVLMKGNTIKARTGSWNGIRFTGYPGVTRNPVFDYEFMMNQNEGGQELYIKMASSELENNGKEGNTSKIKRAGIIAGAVVFVNGILTVAVISYIRKKKSSFKGMAKRRHEKDCENEGLKEDMELPIIDLTAIVNATNNFSSNKKLGEGGFGPVYKGTLPEGQVIAVKRLSTNSGQGPIEFINEVKLIAKLQHRNLVKLLGCCTEENEKILIYEYMPNKSLESFIFDQTKGKLLDWRKRIDIIGGIAKGLLYLHEDSRLRVIHRDLKASNILLDMEMNPKISDFGLARSFQGDQIVSKTHRIVGTYGYMSPEYAVHGQYSVKSDVFSFGVLVLEILSGKKNRGFCDPDHLNLLGHAWRLWIVDRAMELIDESVGDAHTRSEVLRLIQVGLLCVQQRPEDRPNMSYVVLMLSSEVLLPIPRQPGFYADLSIADSLSSNNATYSANGISISTFEAR